jgi:predicted extracellular nuclease
MRTPILYSLPLLALLAGCAAQVDPARGRSGGGSDTGATQTDSGELDTGVEETSADTAEDTTAADTSADTTPAGPTIEIATWNTARFFDRVCDSGRCDAGQNDYEELPSAAQFQYKASQLATGINRQDADIMLLQEVESQDCINALIAALPAGRWPVAVLGEMGQDASVDVAILANGELVDVIRHRNIPLPLPGGGSTTFTREFLEVELLIQGRPVTVFSAHFRSKSNDDPARRLAEARGAAAIVAASAAASPDSLVVLGGDLNDTPDSEPMLALTSPGILVRVAADIVPNDWTYAFNSQRDAIDHLLIATTASGSYVAGSATVLRDATGGLNTSDHASLRASFYLP